MIKIVKSAHMEMLELRDKHGAFCLIHEDHLQDVDVNGCDVSFETDDYKLVAYKVSGRTTEKACVWRLTAIDRHSWVIKAYDYSAKDYLAVAIISNHDAERIELRNADAYEKAGIYEIILDIY
jgi:hypothetical protein